jgi:CheY-like chemotaxis protein
MPILVVDDDRSIREVVAEVLEAEGYAVQTAADGAEALRSVERRRPRLVLLDMRMPVMDGWGFAAALKERGLRLPVIVMSAAADARAWAEQVGADDYLAKPFALDELLAKVERVRAATRAPSEGTAG